jgi:hypothetical protein
MTFSSIIGTLFHLYWQILLIIKLFQPFLKFGTHFKRDKWYNKYYKVRNINSAITEEGVVIFACLHLIWVHYMLYYFYAEFQLISIRNHVSILEILQNFVKIR